MPNPEGRPFTLEEYLGLAVIVDQVNQGLRLEANQVPLLQQDTFVLLQDAVFNQLGGAEGTDPKFREVQERRLRALGIPLLPQVVTSSPSEGRMRDIFVFPRSDEVYVTEGAIDRIKTNGDIYSFALGLSLCQTAFAVGAKEVRVPQPESDQFMERIIIGMANTDPAGERISLTYEDVTELYNHVKEHDSYVVVRGATAQIIVEEQIFGELYGVEDDDLVVNHLVRPVRVEFARQFTRDLRLPFQQAANYRLAAEVTFPSSMPPQTPSSGIRQMEQNALLDLGFHNVGRKPLMQHYLNGNMGLNYVRSIASA